MESNEQQKAASQQPVIYRAFGWIAGTYQPSEENFNHGVLVTLDGQTIPAKMHRRLRNYLKRKYKDDSTCSDLFLKPHQWTVYPQTDPLRFQLTVIKPLDSVLSSDTDLEVSLGDKRPLDQFRMVGNIQSVAGETVNIRIQRNEQPNLWQKNNSEYQPFTLRLVGSVVPDSAVGQIWDLSVRRIGQSLVVVAGQPYQPSLEDLAWIQKQQSIAAEIPQRKAIKSGNKAVDATKAPSIKEAAIPAELTSAVPSYPPASSNASTRPMIGKLEVVVKLNQFPNDVRTVDSGWKEFSVNTGSRIVTITVKPKAFAAMDQAQQTYPLWVAAICGQMGEATALGFRLESPAIKVFERKPQERSTQEQTKSLTRSLQDPTRGKLELTIKINSFPASVRTDVNGWKQFDVDGGDRLVTIAVKPKVFKKLEQAQENYPMWVAAIAGQMGETTERGFVLKEPNIQVFSRKPKDSATSELPQSKDNAEPSPATESQPANAPKTETQLQESPSAKTQSSPVSSPMQRDQENLLQQLATKKPKNPGQNQQPDQVSPGRKQPMASTPSTEPKLEPPRFTVTVNDQVFKGYDSVTLNKRVVRVDGVTVGSAKTIVVLGKPPIMQADGGVSNGRNQAVLTSR